MDTLPSKILLNLKEDIPISVKGFIEPIQHTLSHFHIEWDALANLKVTEPEKAYPTSVFQSFLPSESVAVGECWKIEEVSVNELLRQLNPTPNLDMDNDSGDSYGLWACLRGYNDRFAAVQFRIHAEFILMDGLLTPSQFSGNLIIDRIEQTLAFFNMFVPEGTVNLDINWHEDKNDDFTITDAGFCSQMELKAGIEDVAKNINFEETISKEKAERMLSLRFYKSEQINWVSPFNAIDIAEKQSKLMHVISIDGPLKDESC